MRGVGIDAWTNADRSGLATISTLSRRELTSFTRCDLMTRQWQRGWVSPKPGERVEQARAGAHQLSVNSMSRIEGVQRPPYSVGCAARRWVSQRSNASTG